VGGHWKLIRYVRWCWIGNEITSYEGWSRFEGGSDSDIDLVAGGSRTETWDKEAWSGPATGGGYAPDGQEFFASTVEVKIVHTILMRTPILDLKPGTDYKTEVHKLHCRQSMTIVVFAGPAVMVTPHANPCS
jgi:hypothetical protein